MVFFDDWADLLCKIVPCLEIFEPRIVRGQFEIWSSAMPHLWESPIYGHGAQADRFLLEGKSISEMGWAMRCSVQEFFGRCLFLTVPT